MFLKHKAPLKIGINFWIFNNVTKTHMLLFFKTIIGSLEILINPKCW